jgi:hypothetical protein
MERIEIPVDGKPPVIVNVISRSPDGERAEVTLITREIPLGQDEYRSVSRTKHICRDEPMTLGVVHMNARPIVFVNLTEIVFGVRHHSFPKWKMLAYSVASFIRSLIGWWT